MNYRIERDRTEHERRIANLHHRHTDSSQKYLGTVFNGGAMATSLPAWFLTYPTQVSGSELEGSAGAFTQDTANPNPVLVIGSTVPSVGDVLPARNIGGIWVAERGGNGGCGCCKCTCPDGTLMPATFTAALQGNGVTYGPFTLNPLPCLCVWYLLTTVTIPANGDCPAFTTQLNMEVGFDASVNQWIFSAAFAVVASGYRVGGNATLFWNCQSPLCVGGLPSGFNIPCLQETTPTITGGCIDGGGGLPLALGSCPTPGSTYTGNLMGFGGFDYLLYYIFGVSCTDGFPAEPPALTYTLMASTDGPTPRGSVGGMCQTFAVCGFELAGNTVTVYASKGGRELASGTTGASGTVFLSWTGTAGNYYVVASNGGQSNGATFNLGCGGSTTLQLFNATTIGPLTLTVVHGGGTGTFTLNPTGTGSAAWGYNDGSGDSFDLFCSGPCGGSMTFTMVFTCVLSICASTANTVGYDPINLMWTVPSEGIPVCGNTTSIAITGP